MEWHKKELPFFIFYFFNTDERKKYSRPLARVITVVKLLQERVVGDMQAWVSSSSATTFKRQYSMGVKYTDWSDCLILNPGSAVYRLCLGSCPSSIVYQTQIRKQLPSSNLPVRELFSNVSLVIWPSDLVGRVMTIILPLLVPLFHL